MKNVLLIVFVIIGAIIAYIFAKSQGIVENYVGYNDDAVIDSRPQGFIRDDATVKQAFQVIVNEDANKFAGTTYSNYKPTTVFQTELADVMAYVLDRINKKTSRNFVVLDEQSIKKEQTIDPYDRNVVSKWTVNLFIQEKDVENVHAWSMDITFVLIVKGDVRQIIELHTVTDFYYDKPLVDGINPQDKYYKIMNPLFLNPPWKTSGITGDGKDTILPSDAVSQDELDTWHKDTTTPEYRCFNDQNKPLPGYVQRTGTYEKLADQTRNQTYCQSQNGTWDREVNSDSECPYYLANKNYPNKLGGMKLEDPGRCDMPINVKTIGFRYASTDPQNKPFCYNCRDGINGPGTMGPCCDEQRDLDLYPQLGGNPDFAYPGDELERYQYRDVLAQRGLNWRGIPTNTKNITNANQKQPVFKAFVGN